MGSLTATGLLGTRLLKSDTLTGALLPYVRLGENIMPFVDFVGIDEYLNFLVLTTDSGGIATDADAVPGYSIVNARTGTTLVSGGTTSALAATTGVYVVSEQITTAKGFATGLTYTLLATWEVSSSAYQQQYTFKVD